MKFNKKEILNFMREYGKKIGYPDKIDAKRFIEQGHLEILFNEMVNKKLIEPSWYSQYAMAAKLQYQFWYIRNR